MSKIFVESSKKLMVACAGCFSDVFARCLRTVLSIAAFIGFSFAALLCYSASSDRYTFTFDCDPFVFSIEPMHKVERRFREADEERQADKLVKAGKVSRE